MNQVAFGIDLGTTNTMLAMYYKGKTQVVELGDGCLLPSVVQFSEQGTALRVGAQARNARLLDHEHTVLSVKRSMGHQKSISLGSGVEVTSEKVSAEILKALLEKAKHSIEKAWGSSQISTSRLQIISVRNWVREWVSPWMACRNFFVALRAYRRIDG